MTAPEDIRRLRGLGIFLPDEAEEAEARWRKVDFNAESRAVSFHVEGLPHLASGIRACCVWEVGMYRMHLRNLRVATLADWQRNIEERHAATATTGRGPTA